MRSPRSAAALLGLALAHPEPLHAGDGGAATACLEPLGRARGAAVLRSALAVLEDAGHDPAEFRAELRLEDRLHPDGAGPASARAVSVVFLPRAGRAGYALRVHPADPCAVGWVWDPGRFTPWQRAVLEQASALSRDRTPAEPADIEVLESREHVAVRLWLAGPDADDPQPRTIVLRKSDLAPVRAGTDRPGGLRR